MTDNPQHDQWAAWLLHRRHGGDPELRRHQLEALAPIRDKVIASAALAPGHTVLDVGCGDGLIAFAAAEAVGPTGKVIFSDISSDLLDRCRELATQRGLLLFDGYDLGPVAELAAKVRAIYETIQPADSDPMRNFDERDLVSFAERAGFGEVHLEFTLDIRASPPLPWPAVLNRAANPRVPTLAEAMRQVLTAEETDRMTAHLQPLVERGHGTQRLAVAYLSTTR